VFVLEKKKKRQEEEEEEEKLAFLISFLVSNSIISPSRVSLVDYHQIKTNTRKNGAFIIQSCDDRSPDSQGRRRMPPDGPRRSRLKEEMSLCPKETNTTF
ncbi:MAG: hypothetical protein Q8P67_21510, partial [archaeon]|nr:hypothetical protein [archaeon]